MSKYLEEIISFGDEHKEKKKTKKSLTKRYDVLVLVFVKSF